MGDASFARQAYAEATTHYNQAIAQHPSYAPAVANRAAVHFARGDYKACAEDCNSALSVLQEDTPAQTLRCIPPRGSAMYDVWMCKLLKRRGAAFTKLQQWANGTWNGAWCHSIAHRQNWADSRV